MNTPEIDQAEERMQEEEEEKTMKNRQVDKKVSTQVRMDRGLAQLIKVAAAKRSMTIKAYVEEAVVEHLEEVGQE